MANMPSEIETRLDRLESVEAIRALSTAYAVACDEHDLPRLMGLFTDDAQFDAPNRSMVADGKAAIEALFIRTFQIRGPSYHWTHDIQISINPSNADAASGLVLGHAETSPDGVVSIAAFRYQDDYRRESGDWYFARREIHFLYYVPVTEFSQSLLRQNRVRLGEAWCQADYPEALPAWQQFAARYGSALDRRQQDNAPASTPLKR